MKQKFHQPAYCYNEMRAQEAPSWQNISEIVVLLYYLAARYDLPVAVNLTIKCSSSADRAISCHF